MAPRDDLSQALQLLGLTAIPKNVDDLRRQVVYHSPAASPWRREHTEAYRRIWTSFD